MSQVKSPSSPSKAIAAAAMAGLLGVGTAACGKFPVAGDKDTTPPATTPTTTTSAATPTITSKKKVEDMTFSLFSEQCKGRAGVVQTHAACGGVNSCKGMSFNKWSKELSEHTCKGVNTCAGMSCVELPADTGLSGEGLYNKTCADCHSSMGGDGETGKFKVYFPKGSDAATAEAAFRNRSEVAHVAIVTFGTHGLNPSGNAYANMPAYYGKYSRAEIEKVVQYIRTLTPKGSEYEVQGEP